jgi:hypothetical protein
MSHLFLIGRITKALNVNSTTTKSASYNFPPVFPLLNKDENGPARTAHWKYCGLTGISVSLYPFPLPIF